MTYTAYNADISPPNFQRHLIRQNLLRPLTRQRKKLTLVQAPPGYGKTSLLKQIYDIHTESGIWLNIRQSDNDPISFLSKLTSALSAAEKQNQTSSIIDGFTPPSLTPWIRSLIDRLNQMPEINLFLNDVDLLTNQQSLQIVSDLLTFSHPQIHIYVSATSALSFSYANLLMENQVATITQEALQFTTSDIAAIFILHDKPTPDDKVMNAFIDVSEGWPAASYFVVNQLPNPSEIQQFIKDMHNKQQAFDRYFIERIFEQKSHAVQQLFLRLSMLDKFNFEICRLLSDTQAQCQQFWENVEDHTFITPIDKEGQWFRFHNLFARFLRKQSLLTLQEETLKEYQLKAGQWFLEHKLTEDAIQLAVTCHAYEQAAEWMAVAFSSIVVRQGKHYTYLGWFNAIPESILADYPKVRLGTIWALAASRQFLQVVEQVLWLQQHKSKLSSETQQTIDRTIALVTCAMEGLKDNVVNANPLVTQWLEEWNDPQYFDHIDDYHYETGLALIIKGYCAKCLSLFTEAKEALNNASQHFDAYGTYYGQAWAKSILTVTYAKQGFHHDALQAAEEGYRLATRYLGEKSHSGYGLAALLAAIYYEYDELEKAQSYLQNTLQYLKEQSPVDLLVAAFETQARLLLHHGSAEEAFGFLKDGIKWAESQHLPRLTLRLADELVTWLLRTGRLAEAEQYASEYELILGHSEDFDLENSRHMITARAIVSLFIARSDYQGVNQILTRLLVRAREKGQIRRCCEWLMYLSIAAHYLELEDDAQKYLYEALATASSQKYCRLILDEPSIKPVFQRLNPQQMDSRCQAFYNQLLAKFNCTQHRQANTLIEKLTTKEVEIVRLLEKGLPNKTIAEQLYVSVGTLKWHLHNIYSKLQVRNRTQALLICREQGYL